MPDKSVVTPGNRVAWSTLQAVGIIFLVLGLFEIVQNWVPLRVGEPEWELGTTSHFFDTFPLLGLGLAVLISTGLAAGRRWQVRTLATFCVILAVAMWLVLTLWITVLPLVLKVVSNPVVLQTIKKSATKTAVQALIYPFALLWLAGAAWRASALRSR